MKELEFIEQIKNTLSQKSHIGDDCAYLKNEGIVVTQDSLVEDIHFSLKFTTPYQLGYKATVVNLSDIFASGAVPKYITISLSLPKNIKTDFIKEFYSAVEFLSKQYDFEVIGGDITGSEKIFISICAIGITNGRKISSRSFAKAGDYIVVTGDHGSSAAGLWILQNKQNEPAYENLIKAHLMPAPQNNFSKEISTKIKNNYAMMDTSDGLADALFKIAQLSGVSVSVDFNKIPYNKEIEEVAKLANIDYKDWVLFGGEDYQMVACINKEDLKKLTNNNYTIIGQVEKKQEAYLVEVKHGEDSTLIKSLNKTFNHFKE